MKHIPLVLSASLLATSAFALDAGQNASPPPENPPASTESTKGTDAKGTDAKGTDAKATETKPSKPKEAAGSAAPKAKPERKTSELSSQAYTRILAAEIRKHTPKTSHHQAGSVKISFTVGGSGTVVSHKVQQSSDPALAEIATKVLASIHTPPPPGGKFTGVQQFNFR